MMKKKLKKGHLNILFGRLKESCRVIGPKIEQGVIVLGEIAMDDLYVGIGAGPRLRQSLSSAFSTALQNIVARHPTASYPTLPGHA
jgi:hypothetical protein